MNAEQEKIVTQVKDAVCALYAAHDKALPFHGWHHVDFVSRNATVFAKDLQANVYLVALAALTHDLNYIVEATSGVDSGAALRTQILRKHGITFDMIEEIETIVQSADLRRIHKDISPEAKALSDADTLFKALPITPVIFANAYLQEQGADIRKLADIVVRTQQHLMEQDLYFFSDAAKAYLPWAKTNLQLWQHIQDYLNNHPELAVEGI